ncbi:MAG: CoA-binding protein [Silicimonas sp.]|nr:CoA-binding protein [Silicimonas sp.]
MDHSKPYPEGYIAEILDSVRTIAVVGASPRENRPSYIVMQTLLDAGFDAIPVNPYGGDLILGKSVYASLSDVPEPIDMVDVFRRNEAVMSVVEDVIAAGVKIIWTQLGVVDAKAAEVAEAAGVKVVMNRCPRIELARLDRL